MVNPKLAVALTGRSGEALEEYKKLMLKLNNEVVAAAPEDLLQPAAYISVTNSL